MVEVEDEDEEMGVNKGKQSTIITILTTGTA